MGGGRPRAMVRAERPGRECPGRPPALGGEQPVILTPRDRHPGRPGVLPARPREGTTVTYVITQPCVDVLDKACIDECPVDCIYEGDRMLYIHPDEGGDCGARAQGAP